MIVSLVCILFGSAAFAFISSGDSGLDSALSELNVSAQLDFGNFKADLNLSYNLSTSKVDYFSATLKMEPSDIFMVCELSIISGTSVDKVVEIYKVNKSKGWGAIAKQLGIKPGSSEFKALKGKASNHSEKLKNKNKSQGKGSGKGNKK